MTTKPIGIRITITMANVYQLRQNFIKDLINSTKDFNS